jgi:hypothetical protein
MIRSEMIIFLHLLSVSIQFFSPYVVYNNLPFSGAAPFPCGPAHATTLLVIFFSCELTLLVLRPSANFAANRRAVCDDKRHLSSARASLPPAVAARRLSLAVPRAWKRLPASCAGATEWHEKMGRDGCADLIGCRRV